jgi:F-type H+-transporting ATPase subunit a
MEIRKTILFGALIWSLVSVPFSADAPSPSAAQPPDSPAMAHSAEAGEHPGISLRAVPLLRLGWFQVTNSMLVTWMVALFLILFAQYSMRKMEPVPSGAQNFWEWMVESLYGFLEEIIGASQVQKSFWFFATIFIMILACNWIGLIPGIGSVGWGEPGADGKLHHITRPLFRGANADLNMTLAMAMVFFFFWTVWALQANGPGGLLLHLFGPKGDTTGVLKILMIAVFIVAGLLEVVSILFRPVSLSFRLFGNIYAGESMLEAMASLVPGLGWLVAIPFYFMELLVGVVQALVFMLLTAVFTLLICEHGEESGATAH